MAADSDELRLLDHEPGRFAFFAWKNLTIMVWLALPEVAEVARLIHMGNARASASPSKLSDVHLVTRRVGLPSAATRDALLNASRKGSPHLAAVGVWLAGGGFWASAVRGFVTGLNVLLRGPFELRMFGELDALAAWLPEVHAARTGVTVTTPQLLAVLHRAQRRAESPTHRSSAPASA